MPIHDWTRVIAGTFHDFHQTWIVELKRALNGGVLPDGYYAMAEQRSGQFVPDVLTLKGSTVKEVATEIYSTKSALTIVSIHNKRPEVSVYAEAEVDWYARKSDVVVIRHTSGDRIVAMIEVVSPGNKHSRRAFRQFVKKAVETLEAGVHLMVLDLLPPTRRDREGIHGAIWEEYAGETYEAPPDRPLTLAAYVGAGEDLRKAYVEPAKVGSVLIDMPLFLESDRYVPTPLEATYQSAWEAVPAVYRKALEA